MANKVDAGEKKMKKKILMKKSKAETKKNLYNLPRFLSRRMFFLATDTHTHKDTHSHKIE